MSVTLISSRELSIYTTIMGHVNFILIGPQNSCHLILKSYYTPNSLKHLIILPSQNNYINSLVN